MAAVVLVYYSSGSNQNSLKIAEKTENTFLEKMATDSSNVVVILSMISVYNFRSESGHVCLVMTVKPVTDLGF